MKIIDSHAHINDEKFAEDREKLIGELKKEEVCVINAGCDIETSREVVELSKKHSHLYAVVGISPNDVPKADEQVDDMVEEIRELAKQNNVLAIGEIGLDYYWEKENKEIQKKVFKAQIDIANELELPIVIHSRDASIDTIEILKENPVDKKGVFHCCQFNQEMIKQAVEIGFYISFAGPITFKNTKNAKEVIDLVPLDRILIETDSPYLSPEPVRGKRNNSLNVLHIAEKVSSYKEMRTRIIY